MSEHQKSVTVHAPLQQTYAFFTHFNDFPKFMSFVKEVTYHDDQRSHWVVQIVGVHEWDAVNEDWIADQQIGWRSTNGLQNHGRVKFRAIAPELTQVDVFLSYTPPGGILGETVEQLGAGNHFDAVLQQDLEHFANLVEEAPPGALDPMQSHYLFHADSAVSKGITTDQQQAAMAHDPMMSAQVLQDRAGRIEQERTQARQDKQEYNAALEHQRTLEQQITLEQNAALKQQAEKDQQNQLEQSQQQAADVQPSSTPHPIYDTIGGRNASMERLAFGDQDARGQRFPVQQDPMLSRAPGHLVSSTEPTAADMEIESPWQKAASRPPVTNDEPLQDGHPEPPIETEKDEDSTTQTS